MKTTKQLQSRLKVMVGFIMVLLSFIAYNAHAQDLDKAFEYFENEQYEKAAAEFERILPELEAYYERPNARAARDRRGREKQIDTEEYAEILLYAAISFDRLKDYSKAAVENTELALGYWWSKN